MYKKETSITFTGDIGFDRYMDKRWQDPSFLDERLVDFFNESDHVVPNIEGLLCDIEDNGSHGVFFHATSPEASIVLEKMNADIFSIGNNHTMDAGIDGIFSTQKIAQKMGCQCFGAGINIEQASKPIYINEAGGIGLIGVSYMTECIPATENHPGIFRWDDLDLIQKRIDEIKKRCRWCIIVSHGGEEFACLPNPYTRNRYLKFLEMGADIVVGHHPHVPENYELVGTQKAIFYSLGNFIFDTNYQRVHHYTDTGVILKLILREDGFSFEAIGNRINRQKETVEYMKLPAIFTNIDSQNYELLASLNAAAFIADEKRKMIFLQPELYENANTSVWDEYFFSDQPDGYDKSNHMDLSLIVPLAKKAENEQWKACPLNEVKQYILKNLE